jgi:murein DD-endopeptidase MepM/ murein hydrolase activator NlpD
LRIQLSSVCDLDVDKAGRVQIPTQLLSKYNIGKQVVVIGAGDHIEVWDQATYAKYEAEADTTKAETDFEPFEEPSLSAEIIASGGRDIKVSSDEDIPKNVSVADYKLSQKMVLPLKGKTTSEFGIRTHPISGDLRFHAGIDIAAEKGTNIYSAFDGEVMEADYDKWNGNYIKIKHDNDIMTIYCHCEKLNVKKGQKIRAGEVIATVGSTGSSTGPHLHFELRINNISYNPQKAFKEAKNAV